MSTDLQRAAQVARLLAVGGTPIRHGDGWSNRVWLYPHVVIRIAGHEGPGTLLRETRIASRLPSEVGYPEILGSGRVQGHEWMAQARLPGDNLAASWDGLDSVERGAAVADLWVRLAHLQHANTSGLDLPPTPLYAFEPDVLITQLDDARSIVGPRTCARAADLIDQGLRATATVPSTLAHTDAVLTNVVWTGSAAIPIDFEFAAVGPPDLDLDCVGREVVSHDDPAAIESLRSAAHAFLDSPGARSRLTAYALLRDLWAIGKWLENDPQRTDADTWAPVCDLRADVTGSGWLHRLLD